MTESARRAVKPAEEQAIPADAETSTEVVGEAGDEQARQAGTGSAERPICLGRESWLDIVAMSMKLGAIWIRLSRSGRRPTSIELFTKARRYREEGRFEEAADVVARGLALDARSVVGHLLAAHLHLVFRRVAAAAEDFERALALDPEQPRALLGLARIAFENGESGRCRELLSRALDRYPDFPEARVLFEAIPSVSGARRPEPAADSALKAPPGSLATLVMRDDTVVFAAPPLTAADPLVDHTLRLTRLAAALLARVGYGRLDRAAVHGTASTTYLRRDTGRMLSVTFPVDGPSDDEVQRFWRVVGTAVRVSEARS